MPVKISKSTKDLAYQKLRSGLSNKEVSELTGLSLRSIGRMKSLLDGKTAMPARNARTSQSQIPTAQDKPQTGNEQVTPPALEFQDSPAPVDSEKKNIIDQGLDSIKGMLGIKDTPKGEKKQAPPLTAKLDPKRQAFVDNITPTLTLAFVAVAGAMWQRIGNEYKQLAPDETVATRIVEPLVRVYARHAVFLTEINPDIADVGASVFALAGYVYASLALYQKIKEDKEAYEQESASPYNRDYRNPATAENTVDNPVHRYADVPGASQGHVRGNSQNGRDALDISRASLTPKEAREFEALSRLAELDYQSRARRSGYLH